MRQALGRRATRGKGRGLIRSKKSINLLFFILLLYGLNYEFYFDNSTFLCPHPQIEKTHHNSLSLVLVDDNVETPEETEEREEEERRMEEIREARVREER